ncbi:MAG: class I SAM-dependent methyltransferase [Elainellaceae cyanobacterium]
MLISKFLAQQLRKPTGLFGWLIMGSLLNRGNSRINELVLQNLDLNPADQVLEIGFGGGYLLEKLIKRVKTGCVTGIDLSPEMVSAARFRFRSALSKGICCLHIGSVESLPFDENCFTKVCTVNTIYFWSNLSDGFREIARVLSPGGVLAVGFSDENTLKQSSFAQHNFLLYTPEQIQEALSMNGFTSIEVLRDANEQTGLLCILAQKRETLELR